MIFTLPFVVHLFQQAHHIPCTSLPFSIWKKKNHTSQYEFIRLSHPWESDNHRCWFVLLSHNFSHPLKSSTITGQGEMPIAKDVTKRVWDISEMVAFTGCCESVQTRKRSNLFKQKKLFSAPIASPKNSGTNVNKMHLSPLQPDVKIGVVWIHRSPPPTLFLNRGKASRRPYGMALHINSFWVK